MREHRQEDGFALIMLIGIVAALAMLAATLVFMLDNQQHATAKSRETHTSLTYAEAGLSSAANAVEGTNSWLTAAYTDSSNTGMNAGYYQTYNSTPGAPTVTYLVYDNATPVNTAVHWDANGDGMVWVEADTTYLHRTSRVRELVSSSTKVSILPKAAAWTDTDMDLNGTSNIYGVQNDGTADDSGAPYVTTVMVGGAFTGTSSTTLAYPGHSVQSLGLQVNNVPTSGKLTGVPTNVTFTQGGVGLLSDYFDQAHQAALMTESQAAIIGKAAGNTMFDAAGTSVTKTTTPYTTWTATTSTTWTAPTNTDYVVPASCNTGDLVMGAASGQASTYNFNKLYVADDLTITGNTTVNTTGLYVGGDLTITGTTAASVVDKLGPVYVGGKVYIEGAKNSNATTLSVSTATTASSTPGPMFCKILSVDGDSGSNSTYDTTNKPGPTNITLGVIWVDGDAGTGDIAVNFAGPSAVASTVMCNLLATTEQTHSSGLVNVGTLTQPMIYFMQCDNDGLYSNELHWDSTGTYTGLMILFEAEAEITTGTLNGALLEGCPYKQNSDTGTDLTMNNATICYNQTVINNCTSDNLRTTTTGVVPGSWQQLPTISS
jgi:Tfp pilus assembly protein PilX